MACYDWRTSPYQDVNTDGPHLERAMELVEEAYANTGLPVYLIGHSNGPLYALALLNSTSAAWRTKYIGAQSQGLYICSTTFPGACGLPRY